MRDGGRPRDGLAGRGHHGTGTIHHRVVTAAILTSSSGSGSKMLGLVTASGVGVVMNSRVPGQLIGTAKALGTARELAGMRFLAGMSTNVTGLVLQTVESTVTEWALVRTRQILAHLIGGRTSTLH